MRSKRNRLAWLLLTAIALSGCAGPRVQTREFILSSVKSRDLVGESAVLAFTIPQTKNAGIAYLVFDALRGSGWNSEEGKVIRAAYRRGRRCEWLVDQDWEALFEQPIDEVREKLGVGAPPVYEQMRSPGAPVLA